MLKNIGKRNGRLYFFNIKRELLSIILLSTHRLIYNVFKMHMKHTIQITVSVKNFTF